MSTLHVDVLVVGGGPAGTPLAMALAKEGKRVLLVEDGPGLGGTCLFHGCIPSKIFRESARVRRLVTRAVEFGITGTGGVPAVDWAAIQMRRHAILNGRATGALSAARQLPIVPTTRRSSAYTRWSKALPISWARRLLPSEAERGFPILSQLSILTPL